MATNPNLIPFMQYLAARGVAANGPALTPQPPTLPPGIRTFNPNESIPLGRLTSPTGVVLRNQQGTIMPLRFTPWTPPPGYVAPPPVAGTPVPAGGFTNPVPYQPIDAGRIDPVTGRYTPPAVPVTEQRRQQAAGGTTSGTIPTSPATTTTVSVPPSGGTPGGASAALPQESTGTTPVTPVPSANQPPVVADPLTTYAPGTAIPDGSQEAGWTSEGIRLVTTPDGALRQVDANGNLAGIGTTTPTEQITVLANGVVQVEGGAGRELSVEERADQSLGDEDMAAITPYLAEMRARGETPEQYLEFLTVRAQTETRQTGADITAMQTEQQQLQAGWAAGQPRTPEQEARWLELQGQIDAAQTGATAPRTEDSANWGYANQARDLFTRSGLVEDNDFSPVNVVTGTLDAARAASVTQMGGVIHNAANGESLLGNPVFRTLVSGPANPFTSGDDSLLGVGFDPRQMNAWAQQNAEAVNAAWTNGYDADGDGVADFTGDRAVWELYQGARNIVQRAVTDVALDPLSYIGGTATAGRRIAGEAGDAAPGAIRAVTGGGDEAAEVVTDVVRPTVVDRARQVTGTALQVPDRLINQPIDRAVTATLGAGRDAVMSTRVGQRLFTESAASRGEREVGETLASLGRTTALERRQTQLAAGAQVPEALPSETDALPGVRRFTDQTDAAPLDDFEARQQAAREARRAQNRQALIDAGALDENGQHIDTVVDPLGEASAPSTGRPFQRFGFTSDSNRFRRGEPETPTIGERLDPDANAPVGVATPDDPIPTTTGDVPQETTRARDPRDQAFLDVTNKKWSESGKDRQSLFQAGLIRRVVKGDADDGNIAAGRRFVELTEATWRRATEQGDRATLDSASFQQWMADAETIHGEFGRAGTTSQQKPLAWRRTPDERNAGESGLSIRTQEPNTPAVTRTRLDLADLPLADVDTRRLNEVITARNGSPQETIWDRYKRHYADAEDQGLTVEEATEFASRMTGDDIRRSRGLVKTNKRGEEKGPGWWSSLSGKIAQGLLYKPTTIVRRVLQDSISDRAQIGLAREGGAMELSFDRRLLAEGVRTQQGVRGANDAFGNSEASQIVGDLGLGVAWRPEVTLATSGVDRASGVVRRGDLSAQRMTRVAQGDTPTQRLLERTKYAVQGGPRELINGNGVVGRAALYAAKLAEGIPQVQRSAREQALSTGRRFGLDIDEALVGDAFDLLADRVQQEGRRGFDAAMLRDALRTSARAGLGDESGQLTVQMTRRIDDWSNAVSRSYANDLATLDDGAVRRMEEVLFSYRPTTADEAISKVVFFHYWSSRATAFYVTALMRNPVLAANYFRAREAQERAAEEGNYPQPVKGFFRLMNTDGGFTLYANPTALLQTYATFRDAAGQDDDGRNYLERFLEGEEAFGLGTIGMLNPLLRYGADIVGLLPGGPAFDPLMTNTDRRLVGNAINWARARDYLPNDNEPLDAPYQRLLGTVRDTSSSVLSRFLPGLAEHVESVDPTANQRRQFNDILLTVANERYPDDRERALDEASVAMFDPESDLYQTAWRRYTAGQLTQSGIGLVSPVPIQTRTTQADENRAYQLEVREQNPATDSGTLMDSDPEYATAQVERNLISEDNATGATLTLDTDRAGNVGTPEGRTANRLWSTLAYGDGTELTGLFPEGLPVGGQTYTAEQIAALPQETRFTLADLVLGSNVETASALGDYRTERDTFIGENPVYAGYTEWRGTVRDAATTLSPGATETEALIAWADRTAETNGTFRSWWEGERDYIMRTVDDPAVAADRLAIAATSDDAYLAHSGRKPDLFAAEPTAMTGPDTLAGGGGTGFGEQAPVDPRVRIEEEIAVYNADLALVNATLRSVTGIPTLDYTQIQTGPGRDTADAILQRNGVEPPRMGSALYGYSTWVSERRANEDRTLDAYLRSIQTPTGPATPADLMESRYGR